MMELLVMFGELSINRRVKTLQLKKVKKKHSSSVVCINLREVKSLRRMNHPNIVKLKEAIWENHILN
ncbi:hypothetical protein Bca4012_013243 [Brassica carinata]